MIYVTVGGFVGGFDRLIRKIDEIAPSFQEPIIAQKGRSAYVPHNIKAFEHVNYRDTQEYIRTSRLVVAHAGGGTIIFARKYGVPLIIVPRRKMFNEHYTDHQMELCRMVREEDRKGIYVVENVEDLKQVMDRALAATGTAAEKSEPAKKGILEEIRSFIRSHGE